MVALPSVVLQRATSYTRIEVRILLGLSYSYETNEFNGVVVILGGGQLDKHLVPALASFVRCHPHGATRANVPLSVCTNYFAIDSELFCFHSCFNLEIWIT